MEFFLINHPLDCPICDQAGECGLQDYSFKHGVAYSRFQYEDKRTYPGRERIPLGANVVLNMNRCIQCTRCVRFTQEIARTGELGFFNRGARDRDRHLPGQGAGQPARHLRGRRLPGGRPDLDPLPLRRARLVPRQEAVDLHRLRGGLQHHDRAPARGHQALQAALQPRGQRLLDVRLRPLHLRALQEDAAADQRRASRAEGGNGNGHAPIASGWKDALDTVHRRLQAAQADGAIAFLGSAFLTCEEAYLFGQAGGRGRLAAPLGADRPRPGVDDPALRAAADQRPRAGAEPPRRGAGRARRRRRQDARRARSCCSATAPRGARCWWSATATSAQAPTRTETVERLRQAKFLVVFGWADSPLAQVADVALPVCHHAREGRHVRQRRVAGAALRARLPAAGPDARRRSRRSATSSRVSTPPGRTSRRARCSTAWPASCRPSRA